MTHVHVVLGLGATMWLIGSTIKLRNSDGGLIAEPTDHWLVSPFAQVL